MAASVPLAFACSALSSAPAAPSAVSAGVAPIRNALAEAGSASDAAVNSIVAVEPFFRPSVTRTTSPGAGCAPTFKASCAPEPPSVTAPEIRPALGTLCTPSIEKPKLSRTPAFALSDRLTLVDPGGVRQRKAPAIVRAEIGSLALGDELLQPAFVPSPFMIRS